MTFKTRGRAISGLALGVILFSLPVLAQDAPQSKQKQIADLEKQIDTLNKKLADAKKVASAPTTAASAGELPDSWVKSFTWRSIGPANMGGRITGISVFDADPTTYWIATASGGLLKTVNNGFTFEHQFDREATVSVGAVCVAPSDRNVVWVGTGENNPRNSVSYGDGVYKSTDGGKTWKNMGLQKSFQIGAIIVHPTNPEIVYVGALGRLYGSSPERGLFKTADGGKTWQKILFVDNNTGVIDMRMDPSNPETLLVATWERQRDGYDSYPGGNLPDGLDGYDPAKKWGPGSGIYKTTDGGKSFKQVIQGLPTNKLGRIGLDYYHKDPKVVFAIIDCEKIAMGPAAKVQPPGNGFLGARGEDAGEEKGVKVTDLMPGSAAEQAGLKPGDVIRKVGDKAVKDFEEYTAATRPLNAGDKIKIEIVRENETRTVDLTAGERPGGGGGQARFGPGGATSTRPYAANYGGQAPNVQNQGPNSHEYGGVYKSTDGGESWTRINSVNPRPMYFSQVRVDPLDDKFLYVLGIQLYRSVDGGKTFRPDGGRGVHSDQHALWIDPKDGRHMIVGCDGGYYVTYDRAANWDHLNQMAIGQFYHVALSTKQPYWVFGGLQDNGSWGGPSVGLHGTGPLNEDWYSIGSGDGYVCGVDPTDPDQVYCESQDGGMSRYNLRTGERAAIRPARRQGQPGYRFNWNTPFILSHFNSKIFYCGGNYVFRSLNKGDDLQIISPEITLTKQGSATAVAESPRNPEVLWAGTDDGALWVTRNGGKDWTNVASKVGLPGNRWVATIEASRFVEGRAYVAFDAHRSDDDEPYVYVTEDFGQTWKSLRANLPTGSTRCCREDVVNPDLLYLGTEFAIFASLNRGGSWTKLNNNLPTVAVHEIAVHPTAGEIVAATHGRSLWVLDVSALRQMSAKTVAERVALYKPNTVVRWQAQPTRGHTGRRFVGENPLPGAHVYYSLGSKADKASLKVIDIEGTVLATLTAPTDPGLHKVTWDLARAGGGRAGAGGPDAGRGGQGAAAQGGGQRRGGRGAGAAGQAGNQEGGGQRGGAQVAGGQGGGQGRGGQGGGQGRGGFGGGFRRAVSPGEYRIVLTVDGVEQSNTFRVEADPNTPARILAEDEIRDDIDD